MLSRNDSERILALLNEKVTMVKKLLEKHDQMKLRQGLSYLDELESLQETVKGYHAYLEELKEAIYQKVKEIHIKRYPYNDLLFQHY